MSRSNFYQYINQIDEILGTKFCEENEKKLFELIKNNQSAEDYFFKKIADIRWFYPLKKRGYFKPEKAPGPRPAKEGDFIIPQWNILTYLEDISKKVNIPENENYISELLEIIRNVTDFKDQKGNHIDNYRTWWAFVKILSNIPNKKIPDEIIDLIPIWLDSKFETSLQGSEIINQLLPKFLDENTTEDNTKKAERIIGHITEIRKIPLSKEKEELYGKREEFQFKIDLYWLEKAFEKHEKRIAEKCTITVVENLAEKIKKLLKDQTDGAYESLYVEGQVYEPLDLLTKAIKNILNEKVKLAPNETKKILKDFIKSDFFYFQKIALYVLGQNVNSLIDLVWENLDVIIGNSIKRNYFVSDELKTFLKNLSDLSEKQKKKIKSIVEKGPTEDIPKKDPEKSRLIWKQKIYKALSSDPHFKVLYEDLKEKTKEDTELTPGVVWLGMKAGKEESPLTHEEILKKSNKELAEFFNEFKSKDFWEGPTADGLSDLLKEAVQQNPEKFSSSLNPFIESGYLYVYDILWGLRDAWRAKNSIDWKNLFKFVKDYIKKEGFWEGKFKVEGSHWDANHEWVLRLIGELIQEGTKDDSWAFDAELLPEAEEVLCFVIDEFIKNPPRENREEERDPVTHALNSAAGNIITAFIFLALRKARVEKKDEIIRWSSEIRDKYTKLLESHVNEAYTQLGQFLPNFWFLDKEWVKTQLHRIIGVENIYWSNFMIGYLYGGKVYLDFFKMMIPQYERAIDFEFKEKIAEERFVQHLALGYINSIVELKIDSLMGKLVEMMTPNKMDALTRYFRSYSQGYTKAKEEKKIDISKIDEIQTKIIEFWEHVYEKYKNKVELTDDEKEIISHLLMLTIFLPKLDEKYVQWIIFSLSCMKQFYEGRFLIEDLNTLKERGEQPESGRFVGKILKEILRRTTPTLFKENIKSIVTFLYELKDEETKNIANEICNTYAKQGVTDETTLQLFLRDIYEKYNQ